MELRFAALPAPQPNAAAVLEEHDHTCRWCGFRATTGQHAYREADGADAVACDICFHARHAAGADPELYAPIWAGEIVQADLAHLCRVVAVLQARIRKIDPNDKRVRPETIEANRPRQHAVSVYRELKGRVKPLADNFIRHLGKPLPAAWDDLGTEQRKGLLGGLRLLPLGFTAEDVAAWMNDDSSLNGYGSAVLGENHWFITDIGLEPPPPAEGAAQASDFAPEAFAAPPPAEAKEPAVPLPPRPAPKPRKPAAPAKKVAAGKETSGSADGAAAGAGDVPFPVDLVADVARLQASLAALNFDEPPPSRTPEDALASDFLDSLLDDKSETTGRGDADQSDRA